MIRRALLSTCLALCLALTSLAAVVAQTRMAAAGGYCGSATPQILLDARGLPILDARGDAVATLDCPLCHLAVALMAPQAAGPVHGLTVGRLALPAPAPPLSPLDVRLTPRARAPPA